MENLKQDLIVNLKGTLRSWQSANRYGRYEKANAKEQQVWLIEALLMKHTDATEDEVKELFEHYGFI